MTDTTFDRSVIVAIDHGLHWGVFEGFENPAATLDLLYDSTVPGDHETAEIHTQAFSVEAAASVADAAKVALVYGRDDPGAVIHALSKIDHEDASVDEAATRL